MNDAAARYETLDKPELISLLHDREAELAKLRNHIQNANKKLYGSKSEASKEQILFTFNLPL